MDDVRPAPLRVVIDARVTPDTAGGVARALAALVRAFGDLDGRDEYLLVVRTDAEADYWSGVVRDRQTIVRMPASVRPSWKRRMINRLLFRVLPAKRWPDVPVSSGYFESLGGDVLHFPYQYFELCAMPTVFNPHDLQHLHYPQFFSIDQLVDREILYPAGCRLSQAVIVGSQWIKEDVMAQYGIAPAKIHVIPEGSPSQWTQEPDVALRDDVVARYGLHAPFLLYPAITWPHKNHVRLLDALADLRDRKGLVVPLVCTGAKDASGWPDIQSRLSARGLESQARFLGFVPDADLETIIHLARAVIVPSLFEASSLPIFEAWTAGVPVASSQATALPDQVADAGLLFDPLDTAAIGAAIERLMTDDTLCDDLRARGRRRLDDFDWTRTAKGYRAVYRRVAGRGLTDEDRRLLSWDWARFPERDGAEPAVESAR